jgi:hypothetical protein
VENKTVEQILPRFLVISGQLLTYLKLSCQSLGLIVNWNVILLRNDIQRCPKLSRRIGDDAAGWPALIPIFLGALGVSPSG